MKKFLRRFVAVGSIAGAVLNEYAGALPSWVGIVAGIVGGVLVRLPQFADEAA